MDIPDHTPSDFQTEHNRDVQSETVQLLAMQQFLVQHVPYAQFGVHLESDVPIVGLHIHGNDKLCHLQGRLLKVGLFFQRQ